MLKKFDVIYADPPWKFFDGFRSAPDLSFQKNEKYDVLETEEIKKIPVNKLSKSDCVLFLWTTDAHLPDALSVIKSWGFKYKTIAFIWNKKTVNNKQVCFMGKWTMKGSEICLLATKGKAHKMLKCYNVRQLVEAERKDHSSKPEEVAKRIEKMFGKELKYIELFARKERKGWEVWGNQVKSTLNVLKYELF